jgi:hypothetical protein
MSQPKTSVLRRWGVFGRVLLFLLACPVILVLTSRLQANLQAHRQRLLSVLGLPLRPCYSHCSLYGGRAFASPTLGLIQRWRVGAGCSWGS